MILSSAHCQVLKQVISCVELLCRSFLGSQLSLYFPVLLERNPANALSEALILFILHWNISSFLKYIQMLHLGTLRLCFLCMEKFQGSWELLLSMENSSLRALIRSKIHTDSCGSSCSTLLTPCIHIKAVYPRSLFCYLIIVAHSCFYNFILLSH